MRTRKIKEQEHLSCAEIEWIIDGWVGVYGLIDCSNWIGWMCVLWHG